MKSDLSDFTFIIPIRLDSIIRIENINACIKYLYKHFNTNILVIEASDYNNSILYKLLPKSITYIHIEDRDPIFYRTKFINIAAKIVTTKFVGIWDCDVIVDKSQILSAVNKLREGYDISYPYDGRFYDTTQILRENFIKSLNVRFLTRNYRKMRCIYGKIMKGGGFFANLESYQKAGMENELFYGWGPEDFERYERFKLLEYRIIDISGVMFHLSHPRGMNSTFRSEQQSVKSTRLLHLTRGSSKNELESNIKNNIILSNERNNTINI